MAGVRDRNLRSGDLKEELGLLLLRCVALVSSIPRQEDAGLDAFATLIRPDGNRRLIADASFVVQIKSASLRSVPYIDSDSVAWITNLEIPLFIGRVSLDLCRMELFSTQRLHHILLESAYNEIHLLLDSGDESSEHGCRHVNIGPPVHAWSLEDATQPGFLERTYEILRPHVESIRLNQRLRGIGYQQVLKWNTGQPPVDHAVMMLGSPNDDMQDILREMMPHIRRLLSQILSTKHYDDFPVLLAMIHMMRRWGVDPDPEDSLLRVVALMAEGPKLADEDVIRLRCFACFPRLDLSRLKLREESLVAIPAEVEQLAMVDASITNAGIAHLQRLTRLIRLNLSGTEITDCALEGLAGISSLKWLNIERTRVTETGIARFRTNRPDIEVVY